VLCIPHPSAVKSEVPNRGTDEARNRRTEEADEPANREPGNPNRQITYRPVGREEHNIPAARATQRRTLPMPLLVTPQPPIVAEPLARRRRRAAANGKLDAVGRRAAMCRAAAQLFRDRGCDATAVSDVAR